MSWGRWWSDSIKVQSEGDVSEGKFHVDFKIKRIKCQRSWSYDEAHNLLLLLPGVQKKRLLTR